jgi:serine protease 16
MTIASKILGLFCASSLLSQVASIRSFATVPQDALTAEPGAPAPKFFDQDLDHFNALNTGVLKQRYFVNDTFWNKNASGPVFFMIEGESTASPYWAVYGHHMELAKIHSALVVVVEHRFYGYSLPDNWDLSTAHLAQLSSQQALADLAVLVEFLKKDLGFDEKNKVIAFGGSYPGNLAAWSRIKYPHLFHGAVASSAPVRAQLDFPEYMQTVKKSMSDPLVGGSVECASDVAAAFAETDRIFNSKDASLISALGKKFKACTDINASKNDAKTFISSLAGTFQGAVQYNGQEYPSVQDLCKVMESNRNSSAPIDRLVNVMELPYTSQGAEMPSCFDYQYSSMISSLNVTKIDTSAPAADRQWIYQTCTQFGYYQTCEDDCLFSKLLDLQFFTELCNDVFGLTTRAVSSRIEFSNDYYGGSKPEGSRIVFVNGDIDPWHTLSVTEDLPNDQTSILIRGGSHCQNMQESVEWESSYMKAAKSKIADKVAQWIKPAVTVL